MKRLALLLTVAACGAAPALAPSPPPARATDAAQPTASDSAPAIAPAPPLPSFLVDPPRDEARDKRIHDTFGRHCRLERICAPLYGIDCDAAVDGPYYYVKPDTLEVVARCGGYCMGGRCENCPPKEWRCATY